MSLWGTGYSFYMDVEGCAIVLQFTVIQPSLGPSHHMLSSGEIIFNIMANTFLLNRWIY